MKLTVDTNVLVRAIVQDDVKQGKIAARLLKNTKEIIIPLVVLCELVWVLRRAYGFSKVDIAAAVTALSSVRNVVMNRTAVALGMEFLLAEGDFADGIIAFEGQWLGADMFVSFDKDAVSILSAQGHSAKQL